MQGLVREGMATRPEGLGGRAELPENLLPHLEET